MNSFQNMFKDMINFFQPCDMNSCNDMKEQAAKNYQAFTAANQLIMEMSQAMIRECASTSQANTQKVYDCVRNCMSNPSQKEMQKCVSKLMQDVNENNSNATREILQITSKAMQEILDENNKRFADIAKEMNQATKKAAA